MNYQTHSNSAVALAEPPAFGFDADRLAAADREEEAKARAREASARTARLHARVRALVAEVDPRTCSRFVVAESPEWVQVLVQATQVAITTTTVLLLGESGTGKEVVARFLHRASSRDTGARAGEIQQVESGKGRRPLATPAVYPDAETRTRVTDPTRRDADFRGFSRINKTRRGLPRVSAD
jgi:ABC-type glutathione transport system ATPase component